VEELAVGAAGQGRRTCMRLRKYVYALGGLIALAMAASAAWKNY
jgi:hypothetical protein